MKEITVPELSLVLLMGISGSGKSTFARQHFRETEVISSDRCRALVSDDENNQAATTDAFDLLHFLAAKRLKNGLLTAIDATNIQPDGRKKLMALAKQYHFLTVVIAIDMPEKVCKARNEAREDRNFGSHVIPQQRAQFKKSLRSLKREGFAKVYRLEGEEAVAGIEQITREPLYNNKKEEHGPFDIIGDVHGCIDELKALLEKLGYHMTSAPVGPDSEGYRVTAPEGRKAVFLGDLVDRGPDSPEVLKLVMSMTMQGVALCVPGNHDIKLQKYLKGKQVQIRHGLEATVEQLTPLDEEFKVRVRDWLYTLTSHYVLDGGKLVVAHAGLREDMQGRGSGAARSFCLYGETTGEIDEFGLPVRYDWAMEYRGKAMVVYGHTPVPEAEWLNNTIDIDTGCVFGGKLTALRYPERELVSVDAARVYVEPVRPLEAEADTSLSAQQEADDLLVIEDIMGKRIVDTQLLPSVTIQEENGIAALEVMSRFAVNPKWLIYLPPTMSPSATSSRPDYLEYPAEALSHFRSEGVEKVICEEKHMGSRAVVVLCRSKEVAQKRFGITEGEMGKCYTRTGRAFFSNAIIEKTFVERLCVAMEKAGLWESLNTDWICLDTELMPWSVKAQSLIRSQYASVGAAAAASLQAVDAVLQTSQERYGEKAIALRAKMQKRSQYIDKFRQAYAPYCWPVNSLDDYRLAPFHILATEGEVHTDKPHDWHMEQIGKLCDSGDPMLMKTAFQVVDLQDEAQVAALTDWWVTLTEKGGEGLVMKPLDFTARGKKGLIQPAVKCRGREYLRIIYGPEYTAPEQMHKLKSRALGRKRSMALREYALGVEALQRFVKKEPLRRVHECVFGVLALESESIDPRL